MAESLQELRRRNESPFDAASIVAKNAKVQIKANVSGGPPTAFNLAGVSSYDEILDRVVCMASSGSLLHQVMPIVL